MTVSERRRRGTLAAASIDTTPNALVDLKKAKVSDAVIQAMINAVPVVPEPQIWTLILIGFAVFVPRFVRRQRKTRSVQRLRELSS